MSLSTCLVAGCLDPLPTGQLQGGCGDVEQAGLTEPCSLLPVVCVSLRVEEEARLRGDQPLGCLVPPQGRPVLGSVEEGSAGRLEPLCLCQLLSWRQPRRVQDLLGAPGDLNRSSHGQVMGGMAQLWWAVGWAGIFRHSLNRDLDDEQDHAQVHAPVCSLAGLHFR